MEKRRREGVPLPQDDHNFGIFYLECPEDFDRVLRYMANPRNDAVAVLAPGLLRKDFPRLSKRLRKSIRFVRRDRLADFVARGELLPPGLRT